MNYNENTIKFIGFDNLSVTNEFVEKVKIGEPLILALGLCLNSECLFDCIYCYAKNSMNKINKKMDLDLYKKVIIDAKKNGCETVILTGVSSPSEPLQSPFLIEIVKLIFSLKMKTVIYSNAYVLGNDTLCRKIHSISSKELAVFLFENDVSLMISCDSIFEEDYNKIVQFDAFSSYMNAEKNLCDVGFIGRKFDDHVETRIAISAVISKINYKYLKEMRDYFHQKNWQFICKFPSLMGNALQYDDLFFKSDEVLKLKSITSEIYSDKKETLVVSDENNKKYCLINQLGLAIDGEGKILSCLSGSPILNGKNVFEYPITELLIEKRNMYPIKSGACPKKLKYYSFMENENENLR